MRKQLYGYNISEVNSTIDALREEIDSLKAIIVTLKTRIKNNVSEKNAKYILLEERIKMQDKELMKLSMANEIYSHEADNEIYVMDEVAAAL